jgi:hypothetical protein
VDLEVLAVDDDAFHEQAEDRLLGVEIGVVKLRCQGGREGLNVANSVLRQIALHASGLEFGEREFGRRTVLFQRFDASAEHVERKGSGLIGIGEPITLPSEFSDSGFGLLDSCRLVGRCCGGAFHPSGQLAGEGLGVEKQIAHGRPDSLVDPSSP